MLGTASGFPGFSCKATLPNTGCAQPSQGPAAHDRGALLSLRVHGSTVPSHKARCRRTAWKSGRFGSYPASKALSKRQANTTGHTHGMWRSPFLYSLPISCPFVSAASSLFSQCGWDIPKGRERSLPSRGTAAAGTIAPCRKEEACKQPFCRKAAFPGKAWKEITEAGHAATTTNRCRSAGGAACPGEMASPGNVAH